MKNLARHLFNNVSQIQGWHTNRKIVVFESDDWGSIRTNAPSTLDVLKKRKIPFRKSHYNLYDSLASESDLIHLFDVLKSFKDNNDNHPVITANCLVANPDFDKIKNSDFKEYYYEFFTETLKRYPEHKNSFNLWNEGMNNKIFHPQSHGREHINISRWMNDLQSNFEDVHIAFNLEMYELGTQKKFKNRGGYLAALDGKEKDLIYDREKIIDEGLKIFKRIFGYASKSFIAPNYIWDDMIEKYIFKNGVEFIQTRSAQLVSTDHNLKRKIRRHYLGQKNKFNQVYLLRNCLFEPSEFNNKDWVNNCLREIEIAFRWKKPAIISTHRVNYIGYISSKNRDKNLPLLRELLQKILKNWPEVEFMTSDQLGNLIINDNIKSLK